LKLLSRVEGGSRRVFIEEFLTYSATELAFFEKPYYENPQLLKNLKSIRR